MKFKLSISVLAGQERNLKQHLHIGRAAAELKIGAKMRFLLMALPIAVCVAVYTFFCVRRLLKFYGADVKKKRILVANLLITVVIAILCLNLLSNIGVVILHFIAAFAVTDLVALLVRKLYGTREQGKVFVFFQKLYRCGLIPILAVALIFAYGTMNMNHIRQTAYQIKTDKVEGSYRVVLLTDIHYDTVQSTDILKDKLLEINEQKPDIVVLGGDIVEEGTSKEKMQEVFHLLGSIESRYGVYFIYGNHDEQPYTNVRTFTNEELVQAIEGSGIRILEDEYIEIGTDLILAGRGNAAWGATRKRPSTEEILQGADRNRYIIMVDHQPIEAEENAAQGVDLELSGHTHAGQIWPVGLFTELAGALNYGEYTQGNCKVIVSSGWRGGDILSAQEHTVNMW